MEAAGRSRTKLDDLKWRSHRTPPCIAVIAQRADGGRYGRYRSRRLGYSLPDQVDRDNVGSLRLVWSRALATDGRQQGTPLVRDGMMSLRNPQDIVQAIDAGDRRPESGSTAATGRTTWATT